MATDDSTPRWSTKNRALVRTVTELLETGQYEDLAELLDQVRLACEQEGDTIPAQVLVLARRISLACSQSQAEADWHQQARQEAAQREDKLRHQLNTLLDLAGERDPIPSAPAAMPGPPAPDLPAPVEPLSLRQRLQDLLRRRPAPQPHQRVASEAPVQGLASSPPDQSEDPVLSRTQETEAPSQGCAEDAHGPPPAPAPAKEVPALPPPEPEHEAATVPPAETEIRKEPGPPSLVVYCLGAFRVYQDELLLTDWEGLKAKCILKYLVAHHGTPIVKDVLMDVFWPDADPEAARRNLHQAVYSLRKTLRQRRPDFPYVRFESDCYLLNPDTSAWLDFEQFEQHYRDGQRLEAAGQLAEAIEKYGIAEGLYQGDFLEEDLYEDWPTPQRQHFRTLYLQMADRLSEYYVRHGDLAAAIVLCRKILSLDSCYEEAHRRLMRCYLTQGQRHLAVRQYQICEQALREELDLAPSEETVTIYSHMTVTTA